MHHRNILLAATAAFLMTATTASAIQPGVMITNLWCRAAPRGAPAGGCYLTMVATTDDRLVAVETKAAHHAEIHTMSITDGVMQMRPLPNGIALPAGKKVSLRPGADHLMIIGPKSPMLDGGAVPITLRFKDARPVTLSAPVRVAPLPASSVIGSEGR